MKILINPIRKIFGLLFLTIFFSSYHVNALTTQEANKLISGLVNDINVIINSQKSPTYMYLDFKNLLTKYGDTKIMSQKVLGVDWRRASIRQRQDFQKAFEHYLSMENDLENFLVVL